MVLKRKKLKENRFQLNFASSDDHATYSNPPQTYSDRFFDA